ncbi:MAG: hypothetical protein EP330_03145 [Deltaproteobacteria bacterium]|nr:MAG: hypothetical protein EP330_03145 [Deltaproteobacteria bacterium]
MKTEPRRRPFRGLILAGGGARGAYQAGVLRYIREHFPHADFDVISGSSIGAINGSFVASMGIEGAVRLSAFWRQLRPENVYDFSRGDLVSTPVRLLRPHPAVGHGASVWDATPLRTILERTVPWPNLYRRLDEGRLQAMIVAATDVGTGATVLFADGARAPRSRSHTRVLRTRIRAQHAAASAAIPLIFTPVEVDGHTYVDGSLRQNTPLSPVVDVGADRVLVIGLSRPRDPHRPEVSIAPTPLFLAGKALNALLLDPIDDDLRQLEAINDLLRLGESLHPGFLDAVRAHRYRLIQPLMIRPSFDIGGLAAETFASHRGELPWASRVLLATVAAGEAEEEADLLSYIYMHAPFTRALEESGHEDAAEAHDQLEAFFADDSGGATD